MAKHNIKGEFLSEIFIDQLDVFKLSLTTNTSKSGILLPFEHRGYNVNNIIDEIQESKPREIERWCMCVWNITLCL